MYRKILNLVWIHRIWDDWAWHPMCHEPVSFLCAYFWVFYNDLTVLPHWESLVNKGNHPLLWPQFRLVKYCKSTCTHIYIHIYICIYIYMWIWIYIYIYEYFFHYMFIPCTYCIWVFVMICCISCIIVIIYIHIGVNLKDHVSVVHCTAASVTTCYPAKVIVWVRGSIVLGEGWPFAENGIWSTRNMCQSIWAYLDLSEYSFPHIPSDYHHVS